MSNYLHLLSPTSPTQSASQYTPLYTLLTCQANDLSTCNEFNIQLERRRPAVAVADADVAVAVDVECI